MKITKIRLEEWEISTGRGIEIPTRYLPAYAFLGPETSPHYTYYVEIYGEGSYFKVESSTSLGVEDLVEAVLLSLVSDDDLYAMASTLKQLGEGGDPDFDCVGICHNLKGIWQLGGRLVQLMSRRWCNYSGEINFPVPDPEEVRSAAGTYFELPPWTGRYGELRRDLCLFLAREMLTILEE